MKTVQQVLETKGSTIYSVAPESLVYDALLVMAEHHIGALVVLKRDEIVGIFSERDYAREVVIKGKTSKTTTVQDIMSTQLTTVTPEDTVDYCMNLMSGKRIRHLPVLDNKKLVGLLSIGDLVKETIAYQEFLIKQLESYIQS
ncbi:CBS domain-containing protein [Methylobacillus gramineus]|uniref:CBS domain-containing protein n=1 Tax=Methylobacillus gramineus TaxID=755169 RepID=UPI001CFFA4AF|nr:CBS domain-containing protein [Methylobacillus gramineus]MCB5186085.1 CBS domain-containing protein [Methylobacillus gramineus]